ncbi:hypothetical protein [Moraxella lacunata]|uniref:hypothetical protein n=1 Tax=Moraxella lacunata TaxID=477 RepID=UPI003EE26F22
MATFDGYFKKFACESVSKAVKVKNRAGCPIFCGFVLQICYVVRLQMQGEFTW